MLINANTLLFGQKILLVPYEKHHVDKYHSWMQNQELQELTASLPLSMDEEYQMQETWRNDEDKCTFIILSKNIFETTGDELESMIGDVNLFLNEQDDRLCAEIEIMIAERRARRHGFAMEALCTFLRYAIENLGLQRFTAKIGMENKPSLQLFSIKLQFQTMGQSEIFQEVTLQRKVDASFIELLRMWTPNYSVDHYSVLQHLSTVQQCVNAFE